MKSIIDSPVNEWNNYGPSTQGQAEDPLPWVPAETAWIINDNGNAGISPRKNFTLFDLSQSNGFPKVMSSSPSGDFTVPDRPPLEIASEVNRVFMNS